MIERKPKAGETIVLAYSGGLDTSVAVAWLRETYGFEVVTCTGDLGSVKDLPGIQRKAIQSGAVKCWGDNSIGQLGDGTTTARELPVRVSLPSGVSARAVAGGYDEGIEAGYGGGLVQCGAEEVGA